MNSNQQIFAAITGFEGSKEGVRCAQEYDKTDREEIEETVSATRECYSYYDLSLNEEEICECSIVDAILEFHALNNGCASDESICHCVEAEDNECASDVIFLSL